ncbi:MAG: hypothetical protein IIT36_05390 [Aeriscardovia sp.]|nr:hypothetical protein [Aeriscardovia sp.]
MGLREQRFIYTTLGQELAHPAPVNVRPDRNILIQYDHGDDLNLLDVISRWADEHAGRVLYTFNAQQSYETLVLCGTLILTDKTRWLVATIDSLGRGAHPDTVDTQWQTPGLLTWAARAGKPKNTYWTRLDNVHLLESFPFDDCYFLDFKTDEKTSFLERTKHAPATLIGYFKEGVML